MKPREPCPYCGLVHLRDETDIRRAVTASLRRDPPDRSEYSERLGLIKASRDDPSAVLFCNFFSGRYDYAHWLARQPKSFDFAELQTIRDMLDEPEWMPA